MTTNTRAFTRQEATLRNHRVRVAGVTATLELELEWDDGTISTVDFRPVAEQDGVFIPLLDPEVFAQVQVDPSGRFITWPGDLDFCADALYLLSEARPMR